MGVAVAAVLLLPLIFFLINRWLNRQAALEIEEVELPVVSPRLTWSPNRTKLLEMRHSYSEKGCDEDPDGGKPHGEESTGNAKEAFDCELSACESVERVLN